MESAVAALSGEEMPFPGAISFSAQMASFGSSENLGSFAAKVGDCVVRAMDAIGSSRTMQQVIFWNLLVRNKVRLDEVADKPTEFMEGIRAMFGEAGADVFEYKLIREIKREFGPTDDTGPAERKSLAEVLQFIGLKI